MKTKKTSARQPAPPPAYRGMTGPLTAAGREAVDGLILVLTDLYPPTPGLAVEVYGEYARGGHWRVEEVSFATASAGESFQRSVPASVGLCAACEDYLREFHTPPARPGGRETDLDPKADTEAVLRAVWAAGRVKDAPPRSAPVTAQDLTLALTRGTGPVPVVLAADPEGNEFHFLGRVEVNVEPPAELRRLAADPVGRVVILWPR